MIQVTDALTSNGHAHSLGKLSYLLESLGRMGLTTQEPLLAVKAYAEGLCCIT
ncbi:hypothetical protein LEMLEM_LOCUS817, partial [Lemmus lemmus]